jgi:hypothetical protein
MEDGAVKPSIRELMNKIVRPKTRVSSRQTALSKPLIPIFHQP